MKTRTNKKWDIEKVLDFLAELVIGCSVVAMTVVLAGVIVLTGAGAEPAFADEATIIAKSNQGADAIDLADIKRPTHIGGESVVQYVLNLQGVNPCISRHSQYAYDRQTNLALAFYPIYDVPSDIAGRTSRYWSRVQQIASTANQQATEYHRLLSAYTQVMDAATYNWNAVVSSGGSIETYNRYSTAAACLLDGSTVCSGYSAALRDVYRNMGYESWQVSNDNHAWTCVRVGGEVFTCDPTKDDTSGNRTANFMIRVSDGWQMTAPAPVVNTPEPAPAPAPTQTAAKSAPAADTTPAPVKEAPATPEPEPVKKELKREELEVCKVAVADYKELMAAQQTIYLPIYTGNYQTYHYEPGMKLYHFAEVSENESGKVQATIEK